jgi:hypothetical protein
MTNEESVTAQQHEFRTDVYTEPPRHVDICRLLLKHTLCRFAVGPGT